ncbi:hypothetical protein WOLCODRAFT_103857 [Wolfiporia cocos MD-104 SS10]|uniref:DUF952-domain-containing protein n=1 Tax=Wolfiporia cocos (strain MD-104) TaxID=742152 RepID=A0A2H3JUI3_WOLCO|nr:hypothetical protein WOLCODRAFT_103857 [Wolfiporia cocos MD-104 SS10]
MSDPANVTYVYKLVPANTPPSSPLPEALPVSALDQSSGFVHLSSAAQVPNTLKFFFTDEPRVYVLRIAYARVADKIRWEDPKAEVCGPRGGEGMFPHLYNGFKLGKEEVDSVAVWERKEGESWEEVIKRAEDWLVY